ncbi:MAG: TrbG/VirB9 family P-type conjugative transfer protein [Balneolaceae bacterium]|nr:TrbG/VirB9 family P-type conjugative transfer protein [Balneolaceae bacterium]
MKATTLLLVLLLAVTGTLDARQIAGQEIDIDERGVVVYPINETSDRIEYPFGYAEPVVTASPLRISRIELERGEQIVGQAIGDSHRWQIDYTLQGEGENSRVIFLVKPIIDNIATNFVITTNRRVYDITLKAPKLEEDSTNPTIYFTRGISFYYPGEEKSSLNERLRNHQRELQETILREKRKEEPEQAFHRYVTEEGRYGFPWEPEAIWDNGRHVYIQLPDEAVIDAHELPGVFLTNRFGDKLQMNTTFDPDKNLLKTDRVFRNAKLSYQFEKRRWHGIGRTTRDQILLISLKEEG